MDWDKLRAFHAAAEAGSFTNAGAQLNLSQSAVSRQITALEDGLRVALFHRHARGLKLTEHGELLQDAVRDAGRQPAEAMSLNALRAEMRRSARYRDTLLAAAALWLSGVLWVVLAARIPWFGWLQICAATLLLIWSKIAAHRK